MGLGTLAVDAWWRLYYDPAICSSWTVEQIAGVLYHEVCHLLRAHHARAEAISAEARAWNVSCFPAGTMLAGGTDISAMPAEVITQVGKEAALPMRRYYRGDLVRLRAQGATITATPEHPVLVYRRLRQHDITPSRRGTSPDPEWVPASEITRGFYLVVPRLPGTISVRSLPVDEFIEDGGWNRLVLKQGFPLIPETAWLLGLYVAEGSGVATADLSLGRHEVDLAERALEVVHKLGFRGGITVSRSTLRVNLGGPVLARALKTWCGDGAHNKRIPDFILLHEDVEILRAFLEGLVDGDGYRRPDSPNHKGYVSVATVSAALAHQIRLALARLGLGCHVQEAERGPRRIENTVLPAHTIYIVSWRSGEPLRSTRFLNNRQVACVSAQWKVVPEGIAIPVTDVTLVPFEGLVYNFSTPSHQYIAHGVLVHNCDAEINDDLLTEDVPLPGQPVTPAALGQPDGLLAEEYYAARAAQQSASEQGSASQPPAGGAPPGDGHWGDRQTPDDGGGASLSQPGPASGSPPGDVADSMSATASGQPGAGSGHSGAPPQPPAGPVPKDSAGGSTTTVSAAWAQTPAPGAGHCGSCAHGQHEPWEDGPPGPGTVSGISRAEAELIRRQVAEAIVRIAQSSASRGAVPGHWRRWADETLRPTVDWRHVLAGAIRAALADAMGAVDYSYRRPSRRHSASPDVVLPSLRQPMPEVAVVVDTSESMADRQIAQALAEVAGVLRAAGLRQGVRVLAVDTAVHSCRRVFRPEQVELQGGGGTDMAAGIAAALRLRPRPQVVIVLTDGLTPWPAEPPRGARVVVGQLGPGSSTSPVPEWARVVEVQVSGARRCRPRSRPRRSC